MRKLIIVTSGEPGGIGPDLCLNLHNHHFDDNVFVLILADMNLLQQRATLLGINVDIVDCEQIDYYLTCEKDLLPNKCFVKHHTCNNINTVGILLEVNVSYVISMLHTAVSLSKQYVNSVIVTAPVSKQIINQAGVCFTGHTEYFTEKFNVSRTVMFFYSQQLKIALLTTHTPLTEVSTYITKENIIETVILIHKSINYYFNLSPKIAVCGLNPHAGDGGYIGTEEVKIINPAIYELQKQGYAVYGSYSADTIFKNNEFDIILAMYHDQALPVIKYSNHSVNVTLGLPVLRTSVDHGVALDKAGTGDIDSTSFLQAIDFSTVNHHNL